MKRSMHIAILGKLWVGCTATTSYDLSIGDGPFQVSFDDPTDPDEVWRYVGGNSGDFSIITAIHAVYTEEVVELLAHGNSDDESVRYSEYVSRVLSREVCRFTEEQWVKYEDCYVS